MVLRRDREQRRQAREQVLQSIHHRKELGAGACAQTDSMKHISDISSGTQQPGMSRSNSLPSGVFSASLSAPQPQEAVPNEGEGSPKSGPVGLVRLQLAARGVHSSTHGNVVDDAAIAEELQAQGGKP